MQPMQQVIGHYYPPISASGQHIQAAFDQGLPNGVFQAQHQHLPTVAQQQHYATNMNALEQSFMATTMANNNQGVYAFSEQPTASCCAPKTTSKDKPVFQDGNQDMTSGLLSDSPQTDLYRIPPDFATHDNPMKPEQQAELRRSDPDYIQTIPAYSESGFVGTAALPAETNESSNGIMATLHSCNCGISCQCLACPAHPGNETTQARVEDLNQILLDSENEYIPTADEVSSWNPPLASDGAIMANDGDDADWFPISSQEHPFRQQSENISHPGGYQWAQPAATSQYPVPQSLPSLVAHPNIPLNGNQTFTNNGGNDSAMLSQRYFYYQFPVHYPGEPQ